MIFMDSDVFLHPDTITKALVRLHQGADGVMALYDESPDAELSLVGNYKNLYMNHFLGLKTHSSTVDFVVGSFFLIKSESFQPWPEFKYYGEDSLYGKILSQKGLRLVVGADVLIHHSKPYSPATLAINAFRMGLGWSRLLLMNISRSGDSATAFHAANSQILSILIWGLAWVMIFITRTNILGWLFLAWALIIFLNRDFYRHLARRSSGKILIAGYYLLPMEYLLMLAGIQVGVLSWFWEKGFRKPSLSK